MLGFCDECAGFGRILYENEPAPLPPPPKITNNEYRAYFWDTNPKILHFCPQRSCGKVMFLHLSVILFTGRGVPQHALGQTYSSVHWGRHPLGRHIPACTGADTPRQTYPSMHWGRHIPACTGTDTPPRQTPPSPRADTPQQTPLPPPPGTATAADGMHPTGMHSCFK